MKLFFRKNLALNSGFTLLEALIAISIFTTSILALLSIMTNGIANTNYAKNKIVASYLAEEGVERVRNMRDNLVLFHSEGSQVGWDEFQALVSPGCDDGCRLDDADLNNLIECEESCPALLYDATSGKYNYSSGVGSGYVRTIQAELFGVDEIKISSSVSWTQGSGVKEVTFSESVFNWIE